MSELDFGKFYRFLATKDSGQGWDKYIDNNYGKKTDGVVIKAEFRSFMEKEWTWSPDDTDSAKRDIINAFWAEIDNMVSGKIKTEIGTTLNDNMGLNAKEVDAVDKEIAIFKELNTFLAKLEAPAIIRTPENRKLWKDAVATDLTEALEVWDRSGDVEAFLTGISPKIEKHNAALIYAKEYGESLKTSYLRDLKDYKIVLDDDLNARLNEYFATITGTEVYTDNDAATITDIKDAVEDIINTYLAEAGKGPKAQTVGEDGTVTYTATAGDRLYRECTKLQRAVIENSVLQTLNSFITVNPGYEDLMKQIIGIFVDKLDADKTFDELMTSTTITADFTSSDEYKSFTAVKKVHDRYYNLAGANNAFYAKLVTEYGEDVANVIKEDAAYMDTYKKSVDEVLAKIISGEIDYNNIDAQLANIDNMLLSKLNYQINNIVAEKLIPEASKEGDDSKVHTALKELYETMENTTKKIGNDDAEGKLAEYKESAIVYLDALYRLDGVYKTAIESVLGSDYATAIEGMTKPSDVSSAIAEVETAIELVVVASNIANVNWNSALTDVSLNIGETTTIMGNITGAVDAENAKVNITEMPINYDVTPKAQNGTTIEIDENGEITIKGGAENADISMEVTAEILGVRYRKTVNVNVKEVTKEDVLNDIFAKETLTNTAWGDETLDLDTFYTCNATYGEFLNMQGVPQEEQEQFLESLSLVGIDTSAIYKFDFNGKMTKSKLGTLYNEDAKIRLAYCEDVNAENYHKTLDSVDDSLTKLGYSLISIFETAGLDRDILETAMLNVVKTYVDNGIISTKENDADSAEQLAEDCVAYMDSNRYTTKNRIVMCEDTTCYSSYTWMIHLKDFVDAILEEYFKLA